MSANQKETWELAAEPANFEGIDPDLAAHLAYLGLAGDHAVGVLVWQGEHLEFYTNARAVGEWYGGVRQQAEDLLREYAKLGRNASEAWGEILDRAPIIKVEIGADLKPLFDRMRKSWANTS